MFDRLRAWRRQKAYDEGAPPYVIMTNRQLVELNARTPRRHVWLRWTDHLPQEVPESCSEVSVSTASHCNHMPCASDEHRLRQVHAPSSAHTLPTCATTKSASPRSEQCGDDVDAEHPAIEQRAEHAMRDAERPQIAMAEEQHGAPGPEHCGRGDERRIGEVHAREPDRGERQQQRARTTERIEIVRAQGQHQELLGDAPDRIRQQRPQQVGVDDQQFAKPTDSDGNRGADAEQP
ncbi:MAG: HRDC domain-containing protein [Planctomycetes bacterium]|nr:HRDC domain-containing protein [Planctomycetota bacterium]